MKFKIKRITSLFFIFLLLITQVAAASSFSDMPDKDHWSYRALSNAVTNKLLTGADGYIMPFDNLTRGQMATILTRAYGYTEMADISSYTDVPSDAWYYDAMSIAVNHGIFLGDGTGKLRPADPITRQEVFVVLYRALGEDEGDISVLDAFLDYDKIASWATDAAAFLVGMEYIRGSDGILNPTGQITRAEFAQIMYNLVNDEAIILETGSLVVRDQPKEDDGFGNLVFLN